MKEPVFRLPPYQMAAVLTALSEVQDWSIGFLGIPNLWRQTEGEGVVVAVLDTGCDLKHPDLQGAIVGAKDFSRSLWGPSDRQGHGTWCCGMIGARANDVGVRGIVPKCGLLVGKVLGDNGSGGEDQILAGIEWADAQGAHVISMSLGGPRMGEEVHKAIQRFVAKPHHFVICAAGNDGRDNAVNYPAVWDETIAVAAVDQNGNLTSFSSRGPEVDIAAPGFEMLSTIPITAGSYGRSSGTSMATPVVAGIAAAALAKHLKQGGHTGLETYEDLKRHLTKTAVDKGTPGRDDGFGWGLINPDGLLKELDSPPPVIPPPSVPSPGPSTPIAAVVIEGADGKRWRSTGWEKVA